MRVSAAAYSCAYAMVLPQMASPAVRRATLKSMQKVRSHLLDTRYHESPEVAFEKVPRSSHGAPPPQIYRVSTR